MTDIMVRLSVIEPTDLINLITLKIQLRLSMISEANQQSRVR